MPKGIPAALPEWKACTHADRAKLLEQWHALIAANSEDLGLILTLEQGKPLAEARGEIAYGNAFVKWFAEEARCIGSITIPSPVQNGRILVTKEAVGVYAIITPWNFPNAMITRKITLATGCTLVIKPSEYTPYSAIALAVLAERAGIPAGVVSVVTGMPTAIGAEMTANPIVRKLSFTGSTRVGSILMRDCADSIKRLSVELGERPIHRIRRCRSGSGHRGSAGVEIPQWRSDVRLRQSDPGSVGGL